MVGEAFAFGRGNKDCVFVTRRPGCYVTVSIGSHKGGGNMSYSATFDVNDLHKMSEFFRYLWTEWGSSGLVESWFINDDPCDEWLYTDLRFTEEFTP